MNKELYSDEYIKVSYTDASEINTVFAGAGVELDLKLENVSDQNLRVSAVDITVNDTYVEKSELLDGELAPKRKASGEVHFYFKSFADGNIKSIDDVKTVSFSIKYEIGDTGVKKINGPVSVEI